RVTGPPTLRIEVRYKTASGAKPSLSLIAEVPGGERQYDNSPALPPSETWSTASWTATTKPGVTEARIFLRNSGVGTVWYDDLRVSR
ncbi:MAG: hypothetical protein HYU66_19260, partial [Armatimonadetes bacterium]|nr:hypothetical protein [Armatimonadota bacterium]